MPGSRTSVDSTERRFTAIAQLLANQDWQLVDADALLSAVCESSDVDDTAQMLRRRAIHEYSKVLYDACCQHKDPARRERAFHELHRYLYRAVYNRWPELAEDITQQAVLIVAEQLDRCRQPGTFLSFALFKSRDAMKRVLRDEERWRTRTTPLSETFVDEAVRPLAARVISEERTAAVQSAVALLPARLQQVLMLKYDLGYDDAEISKQLDITVNYVRVLRNRARKRLHVLLEDAGKGDA